MRIALILAVFSVFTSVAAASAQTGEDPETMFSLANTHFRDGDYDRAIKIYDEILEISPDNVSVLKIKGIAHSNAEEHQESLRQFFAVLQQDPGDVIALSGMGLGFGNLGEYRESLRYFEMALEQKPDSVVLNNYKHTVEGVISKYPYTPTAKPVELKDRKVLPIPDWIKNSARWWTDSRIADYDFLKGIEYSVTEGIITVPGNENSRETGGELPAWLKDSVRRWAEGNGSDAEFFGSIWWLSDSGFIDIRRSAEKLDLERDHFDVYLRDITNNVSKEKRYIELPNPSRDVIKKFLRDYVKWNFEEEVEVASKSFPDPTFEIVNGTYVIYYKIYINEQPSGLPLDHVSTLQNSLDFWESQELDTSGQKARVNFILTNDKYEANVWVTWIIRNIGDGVLGHAHLGKGVVEVALGDYNCDGSFQLYDIDSVKAVMTHELGHSIGLMHVEDKSSIMYPAYAPSYAYCLLG